MRIFDRYAASFDGLPLLSGASFQAPGLFFLRVTYLLFSAIPLLLSLLRAVIGLTQSVLFYTGFAMLALPLLLDVFRRLIAADADLSALAVLAASLVLRFFGEAFTSIALLYAYHLCDLILEIPLRLLRSRIDPDRAAFFDRTQRDDGPEDPVGKTVHLGEGQVLVWDCRVLSGSAVCSTRLLDPSSGDFDAYEGDILFAGTRIESGSVLCTVLRAEDPNLPKRVFSRLKSAWDSESDLQRRVYLIGGVLQIALFAFLIWSSFSAAGEQIFPLFAFLAIPAACGFLWRLERVRLLLALSCLIGQGIYPASLEVLDRLSRRVFPFRILDARAMRRGSKKAARRLFYPKRRIRSRLLSVLEYAGEENAWIRRADLIVLYRGVDALGAFAAPLYQSDHLARLLRLLYVLLIAALFLLTSLGTSLIWVFVVLCVFLLFSLLVLWRVLVPFRKSAPARILTFLRRRTGMQHKDQ